MRRFKWIFFFCIGVYSQELPPIQSFTSDDYNGGNQNWAITQDSGNLMYFANNDGLLRYDGNHWQLYPSPNKSILRSVHAANNLIYSGAYMDFGYWKYMPSGELTYYSIVDELGFQMIEDEQVWKIFDYNQFIIFQTLNRLIIYNFLNKSVQVVSSEDKILKSFLCNKNIFIQSANKSIYIVSEGRSNKLIDGNKLDDLNVVNIFNDDEGIYFISDKKGFYRIQNKRIFPSLSNSLPKLQNTLIYSAKKTDSGYYVLGSVMDGILIFDKSGKLLYNYTSEQGLTNNTVLSTYIDNNDNLWVGLDDGIAYLQLNSPIRIFNDNRGSLGTIYAASLYNGMLYLGTNQGLYKKKFNSDQDFSIVPGLEGQVWNLNKLDGKLFCAHDSGMYIIDDNDISQIFDVVGTWGYRLLEHNLILAGTYDGLHVLKKTGNRWEHFKKIDGFDISSRFFELSDKNAVLVSHEYKGVFRLHLNFETYSVEDKRLIVDGRSLYSSLSSLGNSIYYLSNDGFYQFNIESDLFEKNEKINKRIGNHNFLSGKIVNTNDKNLWLFTKNFILKLEKNLFTNEFVDEEYVINQSLRRGLVGFENITSLDNNSYLLGSAKGYIVLNEENDFSLPKRNLMISRVSAANKNNAKLALALDGNVQIPYQYNTIEFKFNIPAYDFLNKIEFRYKLNGYNDEWSPWTSTAKVNFSNLKSGDFELLLQARSGRKIISSTSYTFAIDNPWYLSNFAYATYTLLLIILSLIINWSYTKYYQRQHDKIILENEKKLELIDLKNKEEMMILRNSNLQESVESKNREIAAATMATIKTNKFLHQIIEDLKNLNSVSDVNGIIRTLKRSLDKGDDWKFFEEAFNNTDQNFIKNLKNLHPKLTQSDLKLCAYLRLNLSTKEIAPLFGISVRSVEIKRYRLRKKMNLKSGVTLIDHIVSIS